MNRMLVTGAGGVIASALSERFRADYPGCILVDREPLRPSLTVCDLESLPAVRQLIDEAEPDVVVHLAGNKDVFALEKNPELAKRANVKTTRHIVEALRGSETLIVFISSDYVFEGTDGPYRETSPTRPRTVYGRSKLEAEELLRSCGLPVAIARSASLFGFENDFVSTVKSALSLGQTFAAFSDLVSNPTAVGEFFEILKRIISRRLTGVFHAAGAEADSREAFARKIANAFSLNAGLIRGQPRQETIRPPDLSLDNTATYSALEYCPAALESILRQQKGEILE